MTLQHYGQSLSLLTDLYQLTMAYGYWRQGMADQQAVFHLTFRSCPFGGQYAVACGTETGGRVSGAAVGRRVGRALSGHAAGQRRTAAV